MQRFFVILFFLFTFTVEAKVQSKNPLVLTQGLNTFAFEIYKKEIVRDNFINTVFSPYSVSSLLLILSQGAANDTLTQINNVLHLPENAPDVLQQLSEINKSMEKTAGCDNQFFCLLKKISYRLHLSDMKGLSLANGIWIQRDLALQSDFIEKVNSLEAAKIYDVDFKSPEIARKRINAWVEQNTNALISNLLFPGSLDAKTTLVLVNAIYFKGHWDQSFDEKNTKPLIFKLLDGKTIQVPMMQQTNFFAYYENDALQFIILPYSKTKLAMGVILPKQSSDLKSILEKMNSNLFDKMLGQTYSKNIQLFLPKFKFTSDYFNLGQTLQSLGIMDAFSSKADFSRLTTDKISISSVMQKAIIENNEEGTAAAAATGIVMFTGAPSNPIVVKADHPFLYFIFDRETHVILFLGQVINPNLD